MNAWIRACKPVFEAALKHRRPEGDTRVFKLFFGVLAILAVLALMFTPLPLWQALCFGIGMPLGVTANACLLQFVAGAGKQNRPVHAVLVPGLNRLIRRTAILLWSVAMLGWLLVALVVPHGALVMLGMNAAMLTLTLGRNANATGVVLFVIEVTLLNFAGPAVRDFLEQPAVLAVLCVASAIFSAWVLRWVFPLRGHELPDAAPGVKAGVKAGLKAGVSGQGAGAAACAQQRAYGTRRWSAWLLAQDIRRRVPADLMLHALGPDQHRYAELLAMAVPVVGAGVMMALLALFWPENGFVRGPAPAAIALFCLALVPFASAYRYGQVVAQAAPEQSLFRLAPLCPAAPAINRVLGARLVRIGLAHWGCSAVIILVGSFWYGVSGTNLLREGALILATLAFVGWPLRDYARDTLPARWKVALFANLMLALTLLVAFGMADTPWWPLGLGTLGALSSAFVRYRWQRMLAAPPAFPAGRMATVG